MPDRERTDLTFEEGVVFAADLDSSSEESARISEEVALEIQKAFRELVEGAANELKAMWVHPEGDGCLGLLPRADSALEFAYRVLERWPAERVTVLDRVNVQCEELKCCRVALHKGRVRREKPVSERPLFGGVAIAVCANLSKHPDARREPIVCTDAVVGGLGEHKWRLEDGGHLKILGDTLAERKVFYLVGRLEGVEFERKTLVLMTAGEEEAKRLLKRAGKYGDCICSVPSLGKRVFVFSRADAAAVFACKVVEDARVVRLGAIVHCGEFEVDIESFPDPPVLKGHSLNELFAAASFALEGGVVASSVAVSSLREDLFRYEEGGLPEAPLWSWVRVKLRGYPTDEELATWPVERVAEFAKGYVGTEEQFEEPVKRIYEECVARGSEDPKVHNNLGTIYAMRGDWTTACVHYSRAIEFVPEFGDAWSNMGNAQQMLGLIDEARESHEKATEFGRGPLHKANYAAFLIETNKLEEAAPVIHRAMSEDRVNPSFRFNYGLLMMKKGMAYAAEAHFRFFIGVRPFEAMGYYWLCASLVKQKREMELPMLVERCLELEPNRPVFRQLKAYALVASGEFEDAAAILLGLVDEFPQVVQYKYNLVYCYVKAGQYEKARQAMADMIDVKDVSFKVLNNVGLLEMALGSLPEALSVFERALGVAPGEKTILENIAAVKQLMELADDELSSRLEEFRTRFPESLTPPVFQEIESPRDRVAQVAF